MATLEKVLVTIKPVGAVYKQAYVIEFEHTAPNFVSAKLARQVLDLLKHEYVAEGVQHIKADI